VSVRTVHNSVDLDRFCPEGPSLNLDALAGLPALPSGALRVGLLGTFARWKGHDVFLRALSQIRDAGVRGYIIGAPIYETAASQFSSSLNGSRTDISVLANKYSAPVASPQWIESLIPARQESVIVPCEL